MTQHQSGLVLSEVSGLTENILSVMIHRLCVSNEKNDYMWIVAHFTGLLMSMHICLHVCGSVCVEDTLQGSMQCSQLEEEGLMSQSHSVREAIKCSEESTGHSACLVSFFTPFLNSLSSSDHTSLLFLSFEQLPCFTPFFTLLTD